jgi:hypothetical protein
MPHQQIAPGGLSWASELDDVTRAQAELTGRLADRRRAHRLMRGR